LIRKEIGFVDDTALEAGLAKTIEWYEQRFEQSGPIT
jgi:dTDP-D-glucose 4,6-dehydratase